MEPSILYGREIPFPILATYSRIHNTPSATEGPRLASLRRIQDPADTYLRLANADHEAQAVPSREDLQLDDGITEPNRFVFHNSGMIDTTAYLSEKCWRYHVSFATGAVFYHTNYPVSWWNKHYGSSSRRAFIRFRPALGVRIDQSMDPGPIVWTRGFGLVQFYGKSASAESTMFGIGVVLLLRYHGSNATPRFTTRKFIAVFHGNQVIYSFPIDTNLYHLESVDSTTWILMNSDWVGMRPENNSPNASVNIQFCRWTRTQNVDNPTILHTFGPFNYYTHHGIYLVKSLWVGQVIDDIVPSSWDVSPSIGMIGEVEPTAPEPDFSMVAALYQVESPFREYDFYVPLYIPNSTGQPYRLRLQSARRFVPNSEAFMTPPNQLLQFRGTDNVSHFPDRPFDGTGYNPVLWASQHGNHWYRPSTGTGGDPAHQYWWVQYRLLYQQ